ncbi:SDH family Clp fold serine proteinase [Candidatus Tokpelaia sp.]|uniref:SDH family Clp fold serine proteinase n=1 Tax=Candidatus Tokpelaia sp. TaxID=2233777 RepID=UPI003CC7C665
MIEKLAAHSNKNPAIAILLTTGGGLAELAEKIVEFTHAHYQQVYFIIPDNALSAGTIMCMAGDRI